jgi:hypothetical protein
LRVKITVKIVNNFVTFADTQKISVDNVDKSGYRLSNNMMLFRSNAPSSGKKCNLRLKSWYKSVNYLHTVADTHDMSVDNRMETGTNYPLMMVFSAWKAQGCSYRGGGG